MIGSQSTLGSFPRMNTVSTQVAIWLAIGSMAACPFLSQASVTQSAEGTNLYDFVFDDVPLKEAVREIAVVCGMTILESGVLPDREVTCSLKAVEPVAALNCILGQYDLEAMDIVGDSSCAVWRVLPRIPRSQFVHFVFRQVGDNRSDPLESKISLQMRNAELADILEEIARRTEINLSCSPELRGRFTVGFTNAEARGVFSSLGGVSGINLVPWRWNEGRDYVIMASRFSIPSPSPAIKTRQRTHGWIVGLGVVCVAQFAVILVLLGKRRQATQVDR